LLHVVFTTHVVSHVALLRGPDDLCIQEGSIGTEVGTTWQPRPSWQPITSPHAWCACCVRWGGDSALSRHAPPCLRAQATSRHANSCRVYSIAAQSRARGPETTPSMPPAIHASMTDGVQPRGQFDPIRVKPSRIESIRSDPIRAKPNRGHLHPSQLKRQCLLACVDPWVHTCTCIHMLTRRCLLACVDRLRACP